VRVGHEDLNCLTVYMYNYGINKDPSSSHHPNTKIHSYYKKKSSHVKNNSNRTRHSNRTLYTSVIKLSYLRSSDRLSSHSSINLLFIPVEDGGAFDVGIGKYIDGRGRKLARANILLEQEV